MKVVVQRVSEASVTVNLKVVGSIAKGFLLLVGFTMTDNLKIVEYMAKKICKLRIFPDDEDKLNRSIQDINGEILSISQFTLYADASDGNRPSFTKALNSELSKPLYDAFNSYLENYLGNKIQTGIFGEMMDISLINSGPVTILLEKN